MLKVVGAIAISLCLLRTSTMQADESDFIGDRTVKEWSDQLKSPDAAKRRAALADIIVLESKAAPLTRLVCDVLTDDKGRSQHPRQARLNPHSGLRREAAKALEAIGEKAVPDLQSHLTHKDTEVRSLAADALGRIGPKASSSLTILLMMFSDKDPQVRSSAAHAVSQIEPKHQEGLRQYIKLLDDPDEGVLYVAASALVAYGPKAAEAVKPLARLLKHDLVSIQRMAAIALASISPHIDDVLDELRQAAKSDDVVTRANAQVALEIHAKRAGQLKAAIPAEPVANALTQATTGRVVAVGFGDVQGAMYASAVSPDGRFLATTGENGTVALRELRTATKKSIPITTLLKGHTGIVYTIAFSLDKTTLASAGADGVIVLWDYAKGTQLKQLKGHKSSIASLAFSADKKYLVSADTDGLLCVWNTNGWALLNSTNTHAANAIAISPDGRTFMTGGSDGNIAGWVFGEQKSSGLFGKHEGQVQGLHFSPDGSRLASSGLDKKVVIWDVKSKKSVDTFEGFKGGAKCLAYSPDGKFLAWGTEGKEVYLWPVSEPNAIQMRNHFGRVLSVCFTPDGKRLISTGEGEVLIYAMP